MDAKERIIKQLIKLALEKPVYGLTLMYLEPIQTKAVNTPEGIKEITIAVDGKYLFYDNEFVDSCSDSKLQFILCHEAYHILAGHCDGEFKRRLFRENNRYVDMAMDYEANAFLVEQEGMNLPEGGLYNPVWNSKEWAAERICEELKKQDKRKNDAGQDEQKSQKEKQSQKQDEESEGENRKEKQDKKSESKKGNKKGQKSKEGNKQNQEQDKEQGNQEGQNQKSQNGQKVQKRSEGFDVHLTDTDINNGEKDKKQVEELRQEWKERIQKIIQQAIQQGKIPVELRRRIEERLYPKKDWREELQEFLQLDKMEYSFSPPDRRYIYQDMVIPDLNGREKLEVIVAVDTSGSISQKIFDMFIGHIKGIVDSVQNCQCQVIVCDAQVHGVFDIQDSEKIEKIKFRGGGGTDFCPVFETVEKMNILPHVLIYLTDGEGTFPSQDIVAYPVIWVIHNEKNIEVPFGKVIKIKEEEKNEYSR